MIVTLRPAISDILIPWNVRIIFSILALPAGHVDEGENVYDALTREAKEELSIDVTMDDVVDTFAVNRKNKSLPPYFDVYFEIKSYKGEIKINEPEKCSELVWADLDNLPEDMVDFEIAAIENNKKGVKVSFRYRHICKKI